MALREYSNTTNDVDVNIYHTNGYELSHTEFVNIDNDVNNTQNLPVSPTYTLAQSSNQTFLPPGPTPDNQHVNAMDDRHNETHTSDRLLYNDYSDSVHDVGMGGNPYLYLPPQPVQVSPAPSYFNERASYRNPENIQSAGRTINSSSVSYFTIPMSIQANTGVTIPGSIVMKVEYTTLTWLPAGNM
jgi:hypothetical protein